MVKKIYVLRIEICLSPRKKTLTHNLLHTLMNYQENPGVNLNLKHTNSMMWVKTIIQKNLQKYWYSYPNSNKDTAVSTQKLSRSIQNLLLCNRKILLLLTFHGIVYVLFDPIWYEIVNLLFVLFVTCL